jgi:hypothetical protein
MLFFPVLVVVIRARVLRGVQVGADRDVLHSEFIEQCADRALDRGRVVALEPVQEAACDQAPDICVANFDYDTSKSAPPPLAPACGAASAWSVFPILLFRLHVINA